MRRPLVKQIRHCLQGGSGIGKELYTSRLVASVFHSPYSWRNQNINQVDVLGYRNLCSSCSSVYIMGFWRLHGCGELSLLHFGPKTSVLLTFRWILTSTTLCIGDVSQLATCPWYRYATAQKKTLSIDICWRGERKDEREWVPIRVPPDLPIVKLKDL